MPSVPVILSVATAGLAALAILFVNAVAREDERGAPLLQEEALGMLAVFAVGAVLLGRALRSRLFDYSLVPLTILVVVAAFIYGTARLD